MCSFTWHDIENDIKGFWGYKVDNYIKAISHKREDFSWLCKNEYSGRKKLNTFEDLKGIVKTSMRWFVPTQITGDPQNARLFLCLLNPRIPDSKDVDRDFHYDKLGYRSLNFESNKKDIEKQITTFICNIEKTVLKKELNDKKQYYWNKYYKHLVNGDTLTENYSLWPICNLEYVPYVSKGVLDIPSISKSESHFIVAKIIVLRIVDYLSGRTPKPIFVFRSLSFYMWAINRVLKDNSININDSIELNSILKLQDFLLDTKKENLFYTFSSGRCASLGINNLVKLDKNMKKGQKLSNISYETLKKEQLDL